MAATQPKPPQSGIDVEIRDGIIVARYSGEPTMELVKDAANRIRTFLPPRGKAKLLYDTRDMKEPGLELTSWMFDFNRTIEAKLSRIATVAPDVRVQAHARAAFSGEGNHEFFAGMDEAIEWLKT